MQDMKGHMRRSNMYLYYTLCTYFTATIHGNATRSELHGFLELGHSGRVPWRHYAECTAGTAVIFGFVGTTTLGHGRKLRQDGDTDGKTT